jgi:hypothetical protein
MEVCPKLEDEQLAELEIHKMDTCFFSMFPFVMSASQSSTFGLLSPTYRQMGSVL